VKNRMIIVACNRNKSTKNPTRQGYEKISTQQSLLNCPPTNGTSIYYYNVSMYQCITTMYYEEWTETTSPIIKSKDVKKRVVYIT